MQLPALDDGQAPVACSRFSDKDITMKSTSVLLCLLVTSISLGLSQTAHAGSDPLSTVAAFHEALSKGDKAAALAELHDNVLIYESGHVERSRNEYASHHLGSDMAFSQAVSRKLLKSDVRTHGDLAVVAQETETTGRYKNKDVHLIGVETTVLTRTDDGWSISHVHWSSRKAH